jgi:hypothetical protein
MVSLAMHAKDRRGRFRSWRFSLILPPKAREDARL